MAKLALGLIVGCLFACACSEYRSCVSVSVEFRDPALNSVYLEEYTLTVTIGDETWELPHHPQGDEYKDIGGYVLVLYNSYVSIESKDHRGGPRELTLMFASAVYSGEIDLKLTFGEVEIYGNCSIERTHYWLLERNANTTN